MGIHGALEVTRLLFGTNLQLFGLTEMGARLTLWEQLTSVHTLYYGETVKRPCVF